jgi:hypothetical protein
MYRKKISELFFKIKDEHIQRQILKFCKEDTDDYCERYSLKTKEFWLTVFLWKLADRLYCLYSKENDFNVTYKITGDLQTYRSYYRNKFDEIIERENNLRWFI